MAAAKAQEVDVLIVGAGAAGMMAATCCAAYGIHFAVIDKRPHRIEVGHGDGIHARTLEVLDSFGLASQVVERSCEALKSTMWIRGPDGGIVIDDSVRDTWEPPSRFRSRGFSQAKLQIMMEEFIAKKAGVHVERGTLPEQLTVDMTAEYSVEIVTRTASLASGSTANGTTINNDSRVDNADEVLSDIQQAGGEQHTIRAKYCLAADGSHSWIRLQLGIPMIGEDTSTIWGVMDIIPITNFPRPRMANFLMASKSGLLLIPRENNVVRFYCRLATAESDEAGKLIRSSVTEESLFQAIQDELRPYNISYKYCAWWAAYQISHHVAESNVDESGHVILLGDAVHTHSPAGGQGLNVSMMDSYNVCWKLNLVLRGNAHHDVLRTYTEERLAEGALVVELDRVFSALLSGIEAPPSEDTENTESKDASSVANRTEAGRAWGLRVQGLHLCFPHGIFTSSDSVAHAENYTKKGQLPPGITTGMRMPSYPVRAHWDDTVRYFGDAFRSNGRFRLVVFAGDMRNSNAWDLCRKLSDSIINNLHASYGEAAFDVVMLHKTPGGFQAFNTLDLPDAFHPFDNVHGHDDTKVYYDEDDIVDRGLHYGSAYERYGVDAEAGRLVVLRPDQYVAYQGSLGEWRSVEEYFEKFLIRKDNS